MTLRRELRYAIEEAKNFARQGGTIAQLKAANRHTWQILICEGYLERIFKKPAGKPCARAGKKPGYQIARIDSGPSLPQFWYSPLQDLQADVKTKRRPDVADGAKHCS